MNLPSKLLSPLAPEDGRGTPGSSPQYVSDEAYVTLLTSDSYLAPVLVLSDSLKRVRSTRKLLVLVTAELSAASVDCLAQQGIETRLIQPIGNPASNEYIKNLWRKLKGTADKISLYATVYTKLRIWELTQYRKVVFLDSDMMVLENTDELFGRPDWSSVNAGGELHQYRHWLGLNSGLLVIEPSSAVFNDMMAKISTLKSSDWGDQGFIHAYYPRWPEQQDLHLPHIYNMPIEFIDQYGTELGYRLPSSEKSDSKTIRIIHYWRAYRPWQVPMRNVNLAMLKAQPLYYQAFLLWIRAYVEVCESFRSA
jgi:alpha-N-acetylglucosamine transferase